MAEEMTSAVEFLSRCWVPIIHLESRFMFAYGNTLMEDFLEDLQVTDAMDILMLGVGDIRYMLKTVAGLETRPDAAGCPKSLGFVDITLCMCLIVSEVNDVLGCSLVFLCLSMCSPVTLLRGSRETGCQLHRYRH